MTYALGEAIEELATALAALSWELILILLGAVVVGAAAYWAFEHFFDPKLNEAFEGPINKAYTYVDTELDKLMEKI